MCEDKQELLGLVRKLCYKEGRFTLTSGKESSFYVDSKNVTLHPQGMSLITTCAWRLLNSKKYAAVGGPTLGADPLCTGLSLSAYSAGHVLPAFIIRKEPKKHGTSKWIEGQDNIKPGSEVLIIEDVVTTGGSSVKAIERVREAGFKVTDLLTVIDRDEGGREALKGVGVTLHALLHISEIRTGELLKP